MKTTNLIIALLIGIVFGYLIRMAVHPREDEKQATLGTTLTSIPLDSAKILVANHVGLPGGDCTKGRYYYLSDKMLDALIELRKLHNSDGSVVFFASTIENSEDYDLAVLARTDGKNEETAYYKTTTDDKGTTICPKICDIVGPVADASESSEAETEAEEGEAEPTEEPEKE
jgi:hypothetical protein